MSNKANIKLAAQILDRFFRDAEGRTNRPVDVYFALEDMEVPREKADPAIAYLVSRGLANTFGADVAFLTDKGIQAVVDEVDIGRLPVDHEPNRATQVSRIEPSGALDAESSGGEEPRPPAGPRPNTPLVRVVDDEGERVFDLREVLTVGRVEGNDIWLKDPRASKRHCEIRFEDGRYVLRDLGSANGTIVNGHYADVQPLEHGDRMLIGRTSLIFQCPVVLPDPREATQEEGLSDEASARPEVGPLSAPTGEDAQRLPVPEAVQEAAYEPLAVFEPGEGVRDRRGISVREGVPISTGQLRARQKVETSLDAKSSGPVPDEPIVGEPIPPTADLEEEAPDTGDLEPEGPEPEAPAAERAGLGIGGPGGDRDLSIPVAREAMSGPAFDVTVPPMAEAAPDEIEEAFRSMPSEDERRPPAVAAKAEAKPQVEAEARPAHEIRPVRSPPPEHVVRLLFDDAALEPTPAPVVGRDLATPPESELLGAMDREDLRATDAGITAAGIVRRPPDDIFEEPRTVSDSPLPPGFRAAVERVASREVPSIRADVDAVPEPATGRVERPELTHAPLVRAVTRPPGPANPSEPPHRVTKMGFLEHLRRLKSEAEHFEEAERIHVLYALWVLEQAPSIPGALDRLG